MNPPENSKDATFVRKRIRRILIWTLLIATITLVFMLKEVLFPFFIAAVIAYFLDPLVQFISKNRWFSLPRMWSILIIFVSFFGFLTLFIFLMIPSQDQITFIQKSMEHMSSFFSEKDFNKNFEQFWNQAGETIPLLKNVGLPETKDLSQQVQDTVLSFFQSFLSTLLQILANVPTLIFNLILIPLSVFYFLKDKDLLFKHIRQYTAESKEIVWDEYFQIAHRKIGGYVKAMLISSLAVLVLVTLGYTLYGLPFALVIGIICGITILIPYIGPVIGLAFGCITTLSMGGSFGDVLYAGIYIVVVNTIAGFFIQPKMISETTSIHPLLVIIVVLCGYSLFGLLGMILAVPIALVVEVVLSFLFKEYIGEI